MKRDYTIGLDIGTNSVGWAVVRDDLELVRRRMKVMGNTNRKPIKKNFWGSRLFDAGNTAEERRGFRTTRRRLDRRRNRVRYLQEIFASEMNQVDPNFFMRLNESFLVPSDKKLSKHPIFGTLEEEVAYHETYPTIYHLRKHLADTDEKADLRLVYLAMAHILKNRGHFLIDGPINVNNISVSEQFKAFMKTYNILFPDDAVEVDDALLVKIEAAFKEKIARSFRLDNIKTILKITNNDYLEKFIRLIIGLNANFKDPFNLPEKEVLNLTDKNYEEKFGELTAKIDNKYVELFSDAKNVFDAIELSEILIVPEQPTNAVLSNGMIKRYVEHGEDLKTLKQIMRTEADERYEELWQEVEVTGTLKDAKVMKEIEKLLKKLPLKSETERERLTDNLSQGILLSEESHREDITAVKRLLHSVANADYHTMFNDSSNKAKGYASYIDGGVSEEDFYKEAEKVLKKLPGTEHLLEKIALGEFLRKQRTYRNGSIPHQVHLHELQAILDRQEKYYPFLSENRDKIEKILTFRIPYYVGPLTTTDQSEFAWMKRKDSDGPVRPWNFEEKVDRDGSAARFMENLTSYCTYLPEEKVLPKRSLLYQQYTIFNELNKIRYLDERGMKHNLSAYEKEAIFNQLFKQKARVTKKNLLNFMENELGTVVNDLQGLEVGSRSAFNANYSTYLDLKEVSGMEQILEDPKNDKMLEQIVMILTVFEDRQMIRRQLQTFDDVLTTEQINELAHEEYTGWGRLSEKLLVGLKDQETGKSILDYLKDDDGYPSHPNRNFMQLIRDDRLSFKEQIDAAQDIEKITDISEVVAELPGSPAIKKGILQSLRIVEEIREIMGYDPQTVVIEMAREHQTTARGKSQSARRLDRVKDGIRSLEYPNNDININSLKTEDVSTDKLYLYYLQNGKDMYTLEDIDLSQLHRYEIDHIIPQSFIKDDSFDNRVLVRDVENWRKRNGALTVKNLPEKKAFWKHLHKAGLVSAKKLANLKRITTGELTENDRQRFIQRQLVETRQITKHVANILDGWLNQDKEEKDSRVDIVTLKAALTTQFRQQFKLRKVREINDYHHGHDAYLNAVIGDKLLKIYPEYRSNFVYGEFKYESSNYRGNRATARKYFMSNIMKALKETKVPIVNDDGEIVWDKEKDIPTIRKVLQSRQMNIVMKPEIQTGQMYKETINERGKFKTPQPIKSYLDIEKYGGFIEPTEAYSVAIEYKDAKGRSKNELIGIYIFDQKDYEADPLKFLEDKGYADARVLAKLPKNTLYESDKGYRRITSTTNTGQKGNQYIPSHKVAELVYHARRYDELKFEGSFDYVNEHLDDFSEMLAEIEAFNDRFILANTAMKKVRTIYEKADKNDVKLITESFINLLTLVERGPTRTFQFFGKSIKRDSYRCRGTRGPAREIFDADVIFQSVTGLYETRVRLGDL